MEEKINVEEKLSNIELEGNEEAASIKDAVKNKNLAGFLTTMIGKASVLVMMLVFIFCTGILLTVMVKYYKQSVSNAEAGNYVQYDCLEE